MKRRFSVSGPASASTEVARDLNGADSSAEASAEFLTAKDLEAQWKIDVKTIYGYVRDGLIPYVRIQSNIRFRRHEIQDWIEKQSYRPRAYGRVGKERQ